MSDDKIVEILAPIFYEVRRRIGGPDSNWHEGSPNTIKKDEARRDVRIALSALSAAGYVVVPREPTEDDADMADVGRSLMQAIENYKTHPFLQHWHPANDPAEIVGDLLNAYDEQTAAFDKIADEQKRYLGDGNYEIEPACSAEEAQAIARAMIAAREDEK